MNPNTINYRAALRAHRRALAHHLFDPNVTLIDVGFKIKESQDRRITDQLAVRVHLRTKLRGVAFESFARSNPHRVVREDHLDFPVDIIEARYAYHWQPIASFTRSPRANYHATLLGGISISNAWQYGYGTLGGWVRDRDTGKDMILSAWHVLAGSSYTWPGLGIYQPGTADGGRWPQTIAHFTRHAMSDGIDAAVATLSNWRRPSNSQLGLGPVSGVAEPELGMRVTKSGRASAITSGIVTGINGRMKVNYGGFQRTIRHVVHISQNAGRGQISAGGDSGSWWLEQDSRRAVGVHFAGSNDPEFGLATAMPEVLRALEVEVVTGD